MGDAKVVLVDARDVVEQITSRWGPNGTILYSKTTIQGKVFPISSLEYGFYSQVDRVTMLQCITLAKEVLALRKLIPGDTCGDCTYWEHTSGCACVHNGGCAKTDPGTEFECFRLACPDFDRKGVSTDGKG